MPTTFSVPFILLQATPRVYIARIPGKWLFGHSSPSLCIKSPKLGFQRKVNQLRAKAMANAVLDHEHAFPNALVLATSIEAFTEVSGEIAIPGRTRFLVVDGQHRLNAQEYSSYDAPYAVTIHMGLSPREMATLFLDINDKQRRVASSLRWDLYRLVNPEGKEFDTAAAELVYELATRKESPLFQRIDLTAERPDIPLNQASIAGEIRRLIQTKRFPLLNLDPDAQLEVLEGYLTAIRSLDPDKWDHLTSLYYQPKFLRPLMHLFGDIMLAIPGPITEVVAGQYVPFLERIDLADFDTPEWRAAGGRAGLKAYYERMRDRALAHPN